MLRKYISAILTAALAISLCGCGGTAENTTSSDTSAALTESTEQLAEIEETKEKTDLDKYVSNTVIATGNNYIVEKADNVTYRAYLPTEEYGSFEYRFYFSNNVDSTYDDGEVAHVGMTGGEYTVASAFIADGGTAAGDEITNYTPVTFDGGSESKTVSPGEIFWSDSVDFELADGHFIVWEWTLSGENIPCIYMSSLTDTKADYGDGFTYCDQIPLPQLIGCNREVKLKIAAIGDSITQGCQTTSMAYEYWLSQIYNNIGTDYSVWNCGLGWSRFSDAATDGDWLERTSSADVVIVAFGTNDIASGEYGKGEGSTAGEMNAWLRSILDKLTEKGCKVIVFSAPPENFNKRLEPVRVEFNRIAKLTALEYGAEFFDFASYLCDEADPSVALYGAHPNGEGGKIVADAFVSEFGELLGL
ncbi:MAG: SGNH/GDSL hydrolase family protein [Ruminiclostridium sp.]